MIEIKTCLDKNVLLKIFNECNCDFSENSVAVLAYEGDEIVGNCLYEKHCGYLDILDINPKDDLLLADGLLRSALFVGIESGCIEAYFTEYAPVDLLKKLDFISNIDKKQLNVNKLFSSCQNCGK